jgi:hypothetical protein
MKRYASIELPRQLTRRSRTARRLGSNATQIHGGGAAGVHRGLIYEYGANAPAVHVEVERSQDGRVPVYLWTHFHIEVWLLLIAAPSALEARLRERPEKYKYMA